MNRIALVALAGLVLCLVATAPVALAQQNTVTVNPGLVGPSNPFYGFDVAFDNFLVNNGLADPGDVAHERASEAYVVMQNNNDKAFSRAMYELNRVSEAATNQSTKGLVKAENVLEAIESRLQNRNEETAGVERAMRQIRENMKRLEPPTNVPGPGPYIGIPEDRDHDGKIDAPFGGPDRIDDRTGKPWPSLQE